MGNNYWNAYKRLEEDLINATHIIRFDDSQINTYSDWFSEIILKASVEVESISKELYLMNGGKKYEKEGQMYFDSVCLDYLINLWQLDKKIVYIKGDNIYFENQNNTIIMPLYKANKKGEGSSDWKKAYQAIKHNKNVNYNQASMKNALYVLAALYLLNIYYFKKTIFLGDERSKIHFDNTFGSKIFSIKTIECHSLNGEFNSDPSATYILSYSKTFINEWKQYEDEMNKKLRGLLSSDPRLLDAFNSGILTEDKCKDMGMGIIIEIIGIEKYKEYLSKSMDKVKQNKMLSNIERVAYLNIEE